MKTNKCIILFSFLLMTLLLLTGCQTKGYFFDFEDSSGSSINGFKKYNYDSEYNSSYESSAFEIVENGYEGKALKITNNVANDARVYKKINVQPNSVYEISFMIKTENIIGGNGANVSGYDAQGYAGETYGTTDWHKETVYLKTQDKQKNINFSLCLGGYGNISEGTAYFDSVSIKKVTGIDDNLCFQITPNGSNEKKKSNDVGIGFKILFFVVFASALIFFVFLVIKDKSSEPIPSLKEKKRYVFDKKDLIIALALTAVTASFSFVNLGSTKGTPNNYWKPANSGEYITVKFEKTETVKKFVYFTGIAKGNGKTNVQYLDESGEFVTFATINNQDIQFYKWKTQSVSFTTDTIRVYVDTPGLWINEMGFYSQNEDGFNQINLDLTTQVSEYEETDSSGKAEYLFDEQDDVREEYNLLNSTYFDEIYFPRTAYESINGLSIYERTHPPLGKNIMALGITIFGMNTFGWRFMGTLFGVLLVPLIYLFCLKVFKKKEWAFFGASLIMLDFMRLAQTRLATIDSYACFFTILMLYFMYDYFEMETYKEKLWKSLLPLFLSGLAFGIGASIKWTCLYTGGSLAIIFFVTKINELYKVGSGKTEVKFKNYLLKNFIPTIAACVLFFVVIPATIYLLSYIPYTASNPDKTLIDICIDNQKYMFNYHSGLTDDHSYGSKWYTWPLMIRPIWYYVDNSIASEGLRATISSFGNPAIWWIGIPCIAVACYFAYKNKEKIMGFFVIAFALQYAPWILINRVCFIYHYFSAFVISIFFIIYFFKELYEKKVIGKITVFGYLAVCLALLILFYPVLTGVPAKSEYVQGLRWFSTWNF